MTKRTNTAVWMEKYQRWQIKVQKNGVRKTFTCPIKGRNGQRECNSKADEWLANDNTYSNERAQVLYEKWMEELKLTTGQSHYRKIESNWKTWIRPKIGHLKIKIINEQHLQEVVLGAYKKGRSKKTLTNIRDCMSAFIKYCRKCGATSLVVENVTIPKNAAVGKRTILQPEDINILFKNDKTLYKGKIVHEPFIHAYRFAVVTGLRPGELIGLRWSDVDFDNNILSICRSINVHNEITVGKTKNAIRKISISPLMLKILDDRKADLTNPVSDDAYVFGDDKGNNVINHTLYRRWKQYIKFAGITSDATLYELRHTFISVVKILPVGLVKPIVGHSVNMDTYGTYGHEINGELKQTGELIEIEFDKILKNTKTTQ